MMNRFRKSRKWLGLGMCLCLVGSLMAACESMGMGHDNDHDNDKMMTHSSDKDIIQTATGKDMSQVTTLVKAIKAADLVKDLKGDGPFTVFAPTNAAFNKLPKGTLKDLLKPENKSQLRQILRYHVHQGQSIMAKDIHTTDLSTLNGKDLPVRKTADGVTVNGAKVVRADIVASNGVIHWIDQVLLPSKANRGMMHDKNMMHDKMNDNDMDRDNR